jgi:hypothetical protein
MLARSLVQPASSIKIIVYLRVTCSDLRCHESSILFRRTGGSEAARFCVAGSAAQITGEPAGSPNSTRPTTPKRAVFSSTCCEAVCASRQHRSSKKGRSSTLTRAAGGLRKKRKPRAAPPACQWHLPGGEGI